MRNNMWIWHSQPCREIAFSCTDVRPLWVKQLLSHFSLSLSNPFLYFSVLLRFHDLSCCNARRSSGHYAEPSLSGVEIKRSWQVGSSASHYPLKRPRKGGKWRHGMFLQRWPPLSLTSWFLLACSCWLWPRAVSLNKAANPTWREYNLRTIKKHVLGGFKKLFFC